MTYQIQAFGHEREPVIVIDDFSGHLSGLVSAGRAARYERANGYPGIRSAIDPKSYVGHCMQSSILARAVKKEFGAGQIRFESCAFSIVTLQPDELSPDQRIPHFDEAKSNVVAFVHYLDTAPDCGTAFYRHRRTGFESVTPERLDEYFAARQEDEAEHGPPPLAYHTKNTPRYDRLGAVAAAPDRLIAYRGRQLHSGDIMTPPPLKNVQAEGRLTVTGFLLLA